MKTKKPKNKKIFIDIKIVASTMTKSGKMDCTEVTLNVPIPKDIERFLFK